MIIQKKYSANYEMNRKRWLARYLILLSIGIILIVKIYFMFFIIDFTIGFYSFLTTLILFQVFLFSYFKFKDPIYEIKKEPNDLNPLISIVIPVKNEEGNIENCVQSVINSTYLNKEIIVVNDGSTDSTGKILNQLRNRYPDLLRVLDINIEE